MQTTASNQSVYNYVVTIAPPYTFFKVYRRNEITQTTDH